MLQTPPLQTSPPTTPSSRNASDARSTIECRDPATGAALGRVSVHSPEEVRERIGRARLAQRQWAETSFRERRQVLRALLSRIVDEQEAICRAAVRDSGKTMVDASLGEVVPVCEKLRYTIRRGARDLRPERRASGLLAHKKGWIEYQPLGVVGVICPWNFPFHNLMCPLIPALFAGNGVVAKVSEWSSWSSAYYLELIRSVLRQHGQQGDLVQVVTGFGDTGAALVDGGVDKVFFTGSPGNGRKVVSESAQTLTPVVLELGGKDPMIVCDDANLDHAVRQAMLGVYTACGQMCVGVERVYVFDDIYDAFVTRVTEAARNLRQGPPLEALVDVGSMTMPKQLDIIEDLLRDATEKGARVLTGGKRNQRAGDQFFEPTILVDVDHRMRITQEEQFGPVMVIIKVRSDEEAISLANDSRYGLGSSVFTQNRARGERMARRIRSGMTVVNDYGIAYMMQALPFGGVGVSGYGRINGREGLRACCHVKTMVSDRLPISAGVSVYPIKKQTYPISAAAVRVLFGSGLKQRVRGINQLVQTWAKPDDRGSTP